MLGAIWQSAPYFAKLQTLALRNNSLPGRLDTLPAGFCSSSLPAVQFLDLTGVGLTGSLPAGEPQLASACSSVSQIVGVKSGVCKIQPGSLHADVAAY